MFIAALVNGTPVSRLSVISQLEKQGGKSALDTLIMQTLISNEAGKRNISVSQSELDTQLKTIQTNVEKQGSTLDVALASQGMTKADLTNQLKLELLLNKMIGQSQQVTDKEIDDYITQNKAQLPQNEDENTLRAQIKQQLLQQKQQQQAQQFIQNLRNKAKITYFVNY